MNVYRLDLHLDRKTADLYTDFEKNILQINWKGKVDFEDYKAVLLEGLELIEKKGVINVVLNRLNLEELNVECRVWLKNDFLKEHGKPHIPLLRKVATVESKSTLGRIYTNTISKSVSLVYPNLSFRSFPTEQKAYEWITEEESASKGKKASKKQKKIIRVEDRPPVRQETQEKILTDEKSKDRFLAKFLDFLFGSRKDL